MFFLEKLDEKGRFIGLKAYLSEGNGQYRTNHYSYAYSRDLYKKRGESMGFDRDLEDLTEDILKLRRMGKIGNNEHKSIWRNMRDELKEKYNLTQEEFTVFYRGPHGITK